jgi:hypothetical protein
VNVRLTEDIMSNLDPQSGKDTGPTRTYKIGVVVRDSATDEIVPCEDRVVNLGEEVAHTPKPPNLCVVDIEFNDPDNVDMWIGRPGDYGDVKLFILKLNDAQSAVALARAILGEEEVGS